MIELTQARLKELLHYCPALGLFWWKERAGSKGWNTRFAGEIAGNRTPKGYARITIDGKRYFAQRLAFLYMTGSFPADEVDHANGWRLDNAWSNLREATSSQNKANRKVRSVTGFKGVYLEPSGRYVARAAKDGVNERLGTFDTPEEASAVYERRALELHGQFARAV